jgi:hypothetical protein
LIVDIAPIILSVVALGVSVIVALKQLQLPHRNNASSATLALFSEYREAPLSGARIAVYALPPSCDSCAISSLPDGVREDCIRVAYYFDHLGLLVGHSLLPAEPLVAFLGNACIKSWEKLEPYIQAERVKRNSRIHLIYFEMLAALSIEPDEDSINYALFRRTLGRNPD